MTSLTTSFVSPGAMNSLINSAPAEILEITSEQRSALAERFRQVSLPHHRRLDAWMVERGAGALTPFRWSPTTARRVLGNAALRYRLAHQVSAMAALDEVVVDHLSRAASGYARRGSLSTWLCELSTAQLALVTSDALNWSHSLEEIARSVDGTVEVADSDAYYDVATGRTTLRGRRDLISTTSEQRTIIRVRAGAPGRTAGAGLRADLTIDAFSQPTGHVAQQIIGVWPDAGLLLRVEGSLEDLKAGARDLLRVANLQHTAYFQRALAS
jgi:hypothetical protein